MNEQDRALVERFVSEFISKGLRPRRGRLGDEEFACPNGAPMPCRMRKEGTYEERSQFMAEWLGMTIQDATSLGRGIASGFDGKQYHDGQVDLWNRGRAIGEEVWNRLQAISASKEEK